MKKPRRKYSAERSYMRAARHITRDMCITFTTGTQPKVMNVTINRHVVITETIYKALHTVPYMWTVYPVFLCTKADGTQYITWDEVSSLRPRYKNDLTPDLTAAHIKLAKRTSKLDRVGLGWVAVPFEADLDEETVIELLERHDAECWSRNVRGSVVLDHEKAVTA